MNIFMKCIYFFIYEKKAIGWRGFYIKYWQTICHLILKNMLNNKKNFNYVARDL